MRHFLSLLLTAFAALGGAQARIALPSHFTSNMVVQQQSTLHLRGTASPSSPVTVKASWQKAAVTTQADAQGRWQADISTPKASTKPQTLSVSDGEELRLENILVGEVWLGSGQSNMEMPVAGWGRILDYEKEIEEAQFPMIRLLQVKKVIALSPREQVELNMGGWQECSPQYVPNFSALAYFFARRLWEELKVPIGIIDDSWGGTVAEAWTSQEALGGVQGFAPIVEKLQKTQETYAACDNDMEKLEAQGQADIERCDLGTRSGWQRPSVDDASWMAMQVPGAWEDSALPDFDGIAWLRRSVDIPAEWAGKDLTLSLGNIDDQNVAFWNGEQVGSAAHLGIKSRYTVPGRLVREGKNSVSVRVLDKGGHGGITGPRNEIFVQLDDQHRIALTGTWRIKASTPFDELPFTPQIRGVHNFPTVLWNAMMQPLTDFPLRGFIWYQGCSNVGRARQYESLFQTMIQDWRQRFGNPKMPFYFVQLANYLAPSTCQPDSRWAQLREAQASALCLQNTGMAVNIDLGVANDIHPKTKRELGRRLAAIALHQTYGKKKIPFTAPVYKGMTVRGSEAVIRFSQPQGSEPLVQETNLTGFIMAGPDGQWHAATARTTGPDEVTVSSPEVKFPVAVRYGWADNPTCTLRTESNLHVAPFRTDNW